MKLQLLSIIQTSVLTLAVEKGYANEDIKWTAEQLGVQEKVSEG